MTTAPGERSAEIDLMRWVAHHPEAVIDWLDPCLFPTAGAWWAVRGLLGEVPAFLEDPMIAAAATPPETTDPMDAISALALQAGRDRLTLLRLEPDLTEDDLAEMARIARLIGVAAMRPGNVDATRDLILALVGACSH